MTQKYLCKNLEVKEGKGAYFRENTVLELEKYWFEKLKCVRMLN